MVQAGIAASQGAFASYQQLQNVTHLYAINMQFNASQVKLLVVADGPALVVRARSEIWILRLGSTGLQRCLSRLLSKAAEHFDRSISVWHWLRKAVTSRNACRHTATRSTICSSWL